MTDIAIIGAGIAGLVCAQQLKQVGYSVTVVEKSRGLGGRVATRRLNGTCADHGTCYLKPKGEILEKFVQMLANDHILEVWTDTVYELSTNNNSHQPVAKQTSPCYVAPAGMSTIAKSLAKDLDILLNQKVTEITQTTDKRWCLTLESGNQEITASALVIAIPAPQALTLLQPLDKNVLNNLPGEDFLTQLKSVEFSPSISIMAGYSNDLPLPQWKALNFTDDSILAWMGLDSSKRLQPQQPHFVIQSSARFAQLHLDTQDLQPVGQEMLKHAANSLSFPELENPQWLQVHRWRYAFPINPLQQACLPANTSSPLVCCGDWCGGNLVEGAMSSGIAAAVEINRQLQQSQKLKQLAD